MFLLDTNVILAFLNDDKIVSENLLNTAQDQIFICEIVIDEVFRIRHNAIEAGFRRQGKADLRMAFEGTRAAFNLLCSMNMAPFNQEAEDEYQKLFVANRNLPRNDRIIAATGLAHNLTVVTANVRHFSGLLLETQIVDWSRQT